MGDAAARPFYPTPIPCVVLYTAFHANALTRLKKRQRHAQNTSLQTGFLSNYFNGLRR
jgi:hypothetical protein